MRSRAHGSTHGRVRKYGLCGGRMGGLAGGSGCQLQVTTMVRKGISLLELERARRRAKRRRETKQSRETIRAIDTVRILPFATH